jgi:hypothetical protein
LDAADDKITPENAAQLLVLDGPVSDETMRVHGEKWREMWQSRADCSDKPGEPEKYEIAAQGVAVVVNAANPLKEMSVGLLRKIAEGEGRNWQDVFQKSATEDTENTKRDNGTSPSARGAAPAAPRLIEKNATEQVLRGAQENDPWLRKAGRLNFYTPDVRGPEISLFRKQVLDGKYYRWWARQKTSEEVVRRLAGDPYGVGLISVTDIPAESTFIRVLAVAPVATDVNKEPNAVLPSRETVFSGTYPLSKQLTVYVSPKATETTRDFVKFLATGGESAANPYVDVPKSLSDAMAKHGLLSTKTEIILPTPEVPKPKPKKKFGAEGGGKPKTPVGAGGGDIPGGW